MEASNKRSMSIHIALEVAMRQGSDVLSATSIPGMPRFGKRATVLLLMKDRRGDFRVTSFCEPDSEFGQGFYYVDEDKARSEYLSFVRREWIDLQTHTEIAERLEKQGKQ